MSYEKLFFNSLIAFLLTQILYHYSGSQIIKYLLYAEEIFFIIFSLLVVSQAAQKLTYKFLFLILFIVLVSFNLFVNDENSADDIFKIFGAISIFISAYYLNHEINKNKYGKKKVLLIALLPLIIYVLDSVVGFRITDKSMAFFPNSNNYIFYSICCIWLMIVYNVSTKVILAFTLISFAITSTLGALLGFAAASCYYFRRHILQMKYIPVMLSAGTVVAYLVIFSDIHLFQRARGSFDVFQTLLKSYDITQIAEVSFGDAMTLSGSQDGGDVSFLFRLKLWTEVLQYFFAQDLPYLIFGLGFGTVPQINSFGLVAHNDYLAWFIEGGLLLFLLLVYGVWSGFNLLKRTIFIIPYMSILIYLFSENLYYNFFAIAIFSYCLATSMKIVQNESHTDQ